MKIVAIMTIRNESAYLPVVLQHLYDQGIYVYLIDNDSTDTSVDIVRTFLDKNVIKIDRIEFNGVYEWEKILAHKEQVANQIEADWFIHHDADEIREAPREYLTLAEGIKAVDSLGYNAINFDEFVFVPSNDNESFVGKNYIREMQYYYYFEPNQLHRINAWKKQTTPVDLRAKGGHQVNFADRKVFTSNFILRHYLALSRETLINKYCGRRYSDYEVNELGWHRKRANFDSKNLKLLQSEDLCFLSEDTWDKSNPLKVHPFFK